MKSAFLTLPADATSLAGALAAEQGPVVVMPYTDRALAARAAAQLAARAGADGLLLAVEDAARQGYVAVANAVFRATRSTVFGYVAQDAFAGRGWLARGEAALRAHGAALLGFNDGKWLGALAAFGLVARDWAGGNYGGDLFWRGYARHYADAELTVLAMNARRYLYDANCVVVEVDAEKDGGGVDAEDRRLYRARAAAGFDGRVADEALRALFA